MIHKIIKKEIQVPGTLEDTYMETFLLSVTDKFTVQERPLILVCPGGGYNHTSDREAEIVAMQFNAMGYHTAVLRYSCKPAVFPTALLELTKAVAFLREHAGECCIDPDRIAVLGFSGGIAGRLLEYRVVCADPEGERRESYGAADKARRPDTGLSGDHFRGICPSGLLRRSAGRGAKRRPGLACQNVPGEAGYQGYAAGLHVAYVL